jgi:hypothetical protein
MEQLELRRVAVVRRHGGRMSSLRTESRTTHRNDASTVTAERPRAVDLAVGAEALRARLATRPDAEPEWVRPGRVALMKGVSGWILLTFLLAYVVNPALVNAVGVDLRLISIAASGPAMALTGGLVVLLVGALRPSVRLPRRRGALDTNPEVAATAGSLLVWGAAEQLLPVFQPFTTMPLGELAALIGLNVIESALFGVMLASFTRSPGKAFAIGAAFQLVLTTLVAFGALIGLG